MYHVYSAKFQKMWEAIAQVDGNINDHPSFPDSLGDTPWTLASIGDILGYVEEEIYSIAGHFDTEHVDESITRLGKPYLSFGDKLIINSGGTSPLVEAIISRVRHPAVRACFKNTRVEANLFRIIHDFSAEKVQKDFTSSLYQIQPFPLQLKKDSIKERDGVKEYYAEMGVTNEAELYARSIRDFVLNGYILVFTRGFDLCDLSIAASAQCLPFCMDFLDVYDGSNFATKEAYRAALNDSVTLYGGGKYAAIMEQVVITAAFLVYKNEITAGAKNGDILPRVTDDQAPSPLEYNEVRWLDGFLAKFLKFPIVLADGAGIPVDDRLNPIGTRICPSIRRCLDLYLLSNDIIDLISDFHGEPMNSVSVAARYGGRTAVIGYADACASCVVDDCAKCSCDASDKAHDWASDLAQGVLVIYGLDPRYVAVTQIAELNHLTSQVYKELINSSKHGPFTSGKLAKFYSNVPALHEKEWKPLYNIVIVPPSEGSEECRHCQTIGTWLVNRGLYRERRNILENQVRKFVKERLHLKPKAEMDKFWGELLFMLVGEECNTEIVQECAGIVNSIWNLLRLAIDDDDVELNIIRKRQIRIYFELVKVVTRSHEFLDGHHLRRAVIGLISVMLDRTDVFVFQRVLDGLLEYSRQLEMLNFTDENLNKFQGK